MAASASAVATAKEAASIATDFHTGSSLLGSHQLPRAGQKWAFSAPILISLSSYVKGQINPPRVLHRRLQIPCPLVHYL
jgi:hypothetical protein